MKTEKNCHICRLTKPVQEFYQSRNHNDGFQSRCIPCEKRYQKSRRHLYAERNNEYRKNWREENKERVLATDRRYRSNNKEIWAAKERRRRANFKNNPVFKIPARQLKKLYSSCCAYCGGTEKITLDHVVPIQRGGSHSIGNLLPACVSCNSSKGQRLLIEWKYKKKLERETND